MLRTRHASKWQNIKTHRAKDQIDSRNEDRPAGHGNRKIPLRILYFRTHAIQILPPVISPKRRRKRRQKARKCSDPRFRGPERMEIRGAAVPQSKRRRYDRQNRGHLDHRQNNLHAAADPYAQIIDHCEDQQRAHGHRLGPGECEFVGLGREGNREMKSKKRHSDRRNKHTQKSRESSSNGSSRSRFADRRVHPAKKKSPNRPQPAAQISILSASLRNRRPQFSKRKRPKKRKQSANNPRRINHANRAALSSHLARL